MSRLECKEHTYIDDVPLEIACTQKHANGIWDNAKLPLNNKCTTDSSQVSIKTTGVLSATY